MKHLQILLLLSVAILIIGCWAKDHLLPATPHLQEPIIEISVVDEANMPVPSACALPADVDWSGPPYYADSNGIIHLTAIIGKDILIFAPRYKDYRIPAITWPTNRFPVVTLALKQDE